MDNLFPKQEFYLVPPFCIGTGENMGDATLFIISKDPDFSITCGQVVMVLGRFLKVRRIEVVMDLLDIVWTLTCNIVSLDPRATLSDDYTKPGYLTTSSGPYIKDPTQITYIHLNL